MSFTEALKTHKLPVEPDENTEYRGFSMMDNEIDFPVDAFPEFYADLIWEVSKNIKSEPSHLGTGILAAVSAFLGNTYHTQLANFYSPVPGSVWMATIEASGRGKGKARSFTQAPVKRYQDQKDLEYQNAKHRMQMDIHETKKNIATNAMPDVVKELKRELAIEEIKFANLKRTNLIITDTTIESIRRECIKNPRGLYIMLGELASWYGDFGKYTKGGGNGEEGKWIAIHDGEDLRPTRAGSEQESAKHPFVTVFGDTQAKMLIDLGKNGRMVSGFVFRMLFSFPEYKPREKAAYADLRSDGQRISELKDQYVNKMMQLVGLEMDYLDDSKTIPDPKVLPFSDDAQMVYTDWVNDNIDFANSANFELDIKYDIDSICARLEMSMIRMCLLMEALKYTLGESSLTKISKDTVVRCAALMEYYRYTALKVYSEVEKIRFETVGHRPRRYRIPYKKIFGQRKELSFRDLIERIERNTTLTTFTAIKYLKEDADQPVPDIIVRKEGRNKFYQLNPLKIK